MERGDRSGVYRQASSIPEEVRRATARLSSDTDHAVLYTIKQSGTTRYTWLRQELQIPDQEIVEALGRLYSIGFIERTAAGRGVGRESAYVVTETGDTFLQTVRKRDDADQEPEEPSSDPSPSSKPERKERRRMGGRRKHPDPRPAKERTKAPTKYTGADPPQKRERERKRRKHPDPRPAKERKKAPSKDSEPEPEPEPELEEPEMGTSKLSIHEPL